MDDLFEQWGDLTLDQQRRRIASAAAAMSDLPIQGQAEGAPAWLEVLARFFASCVTVREQDAAAAASSVRMSDAFASHLTDGGPPRDTGPRDEAKRHADAYRGFTESSWRRRLVEAIAEHAGVPVEPIRDTGLPTKELKRVRFGLAGVGPDADPRQMALTATVEADVDRTTAPLAKLLADAFAGCTPSEPRRLREAPQRLACGDRRRQAGWV